jgi:hypothetical protein
VRARPPLRALASVLAVAPLLAACPGRDVPHPSGAIGDCGGLAPAECKRAQGMIAATRVYSNVTHDLILDPTSSFAPGRGVERSSGVTKVHPTQCASPRAGVAHDVDAQTVDFAYVGLAIDETIVGLDEDITPYFSGGVEGRTRKVRLVALAFVRDKDPQFFEASSDVTYQGAGCACGTSTHFVGAVKMGGMLSYEMNVKAGEVHARALELVKVKVGRSDTAVTQHQVGGLEVDGLEAQLEGGPPRPLSFRVKNPVPVAYALYPVSDVCKLSLPVPEVSPPLVDFGDVPYGKTGQRLLHIVNRATLDLYADHGGATYAVPAQGSLDVPVTWKPSGDAPGCEVQTREETLVFTPRDASAPVVPKQQAVRVVERVRTGRPTVERRERIDSGEARKPNYAATNRELACPPDYVVESCKAEATQCGDGKCDKYAFVAHEQGGKCQFGCSGPDSLVFGSNHCRFEAVATCKLRCPP